MPEFSLPHDHGTHQHEEEVRRVLADDARFSAVAELFRSLGDPTRVRIFWLLSHREECVINIAAMLDMSSPAVSHHLRSLAENGLLESRRDGKEVYYRAADTEVAGLLHQVIERTVEVTCPREEAMPHAPHLPPVDAHAGEHAADLTPQQRQTYTDTVVQQSERLAAMSTHILELAQYENTEIVSGKAVYSLDEQLRRCVRQQERDWLKKGLTVEGDLDRVDYYGNEELAEHIWSNLLSDAIRFTPAGGQITIVLRQGEGEVTVSVSDTGIGMDEDTQQHIFDKFYRAAPYSDIRGNGLGLSIVRRAVALCGGQIAVFSRPGKGSTFTVTLPAAQE